MATLLKKIFVKNLDNVENQDIFTEELKKSEHDNLDSTLNIEGEKLTVRKKGQDKKESAPLEKQKHKDKQDEELFNDDYIDNKDSRKKEKTEDKKAEKKIEPKGTEENIITNDVKPIFEPVLSFEKEPRKIETETKKELHPELPTTIDKIEKKPEVTIELEKTVKSVDELSSPIKEEKKPKEEVTKVVKDLNNNLSIDNLKKSPNIYIDTKEIELKLRELEDLVYNYSNLIYKSDDKDEIDYYIKQLYEIIEEINNLLKKLHKENELIKVDGLKITNKDEFLTNFERLTNKLETVKKEYVDKEIEAANIKRDIIEDRDKEKDKKMLEVDRQAKEAEYFQKKIKNDLYYLINTKKTIDQITETRERVQRTYVGVRRAMNNLYNGLMAATMLPGPLAFFAIMGAHIRATIELAREMVNPRYVENVYEETVVTRITDTTRTIDDSDFYKAEKDLDEIIKDFDYLMKECYRLFNENPNYKDLFDELQEIKALLDSQKQELTDLQKSSSKELVLQREPINN